MHDHRELPLAVISPYIRNIINMIYLLGRMNLIYRTHYVLGLNPSDHSYRRVTVARNPLGVGRGVNATIPRYGIAKSATRACAPAPGARATKHTKPAF